jgi:hypothetical protein
MAPLDGKEPVKPVPFDAHEQATRGTDSPAEFAEFPKAVDHVDHPSGVGLQPVVVNSAEEEEAYLDAKAADAPEPETSKPAAEPEAE